MANYLELLRRNVWLGVLIGVILGLVLGLLIGWVLVPVSWVPSSDDVAAVADSYYVNGDANLAARRLSGLSKDDLARILTARVKDASANNRTLEERNLRNLAQALNVPIGTTPAGTTVPTSTAPRPGATTTPTTAAAPTNNLVGILLIVLVIILIAAAGAIFYLRVLPNMRASRPARAATAATTPAPGARTAEPAPRAPPTAATAPATAPTTTAGGLGRFVPSYTLGNDNYDTSFSLETPRGEFLGECGMGISETIGDGKPDKVTAFDLWLFDKADVRTVTQILMTEYAYKDPNLRTKLATKGEAILAEKGKTLQLETQSLRLDAQIVELVYATNANFPPNSHFQKLVVEIVPAMKDGAAAR